ncbi:hypothetical protein OG767_29820 [Micromonospora sp. NBC_01392]|uniref:hypothetical protein n=1 Tax=Micromonospora sp. NBC_01392 TaxID=2903588 RepID=UPI0032524C4A
MRGDLDETLARLARREEAQRRRVPLPGEPVEHADTGTPAEHADTGTPAEHADAGRPAKHAEPGAPAGVEPVEDRAGHGAYRLRGGHASPRRDPVEEVAEAVRRVVAAHRGLAVTLRVELGDQAYPMRVSWAGPEVTVGPASTPAPPPTWPMSVKTVAAPGHDPRATDPAARLAELIRRDPSLLDGPGPH